MSGRSFFRQAKVRAVLAKTLGAVAHPSAVSSRIQPKRNEHGSSITLLRRARMEDTLYAFAARERDHPDDIYLQHNRR
jgi:hypothetical protein